MSETILEREPGLCLDGPAARRLRRRMLSPLWMRLFMLGKLPLGLLAGLCLRELDSERCAASVRYRWLTTNPFRSTYFAALAMAAEMSCGALAIVAVRLAPASVSMLPVRMESSFEKKATGRTTFTCEDGAAIAQAVEATLASGAPATIDVQTIGRAEDGTVIARFTFGWSFKRR